MALGGEWELTVKLPNTEAVRLVGSETFSEKEKSSTPTSGRRLQIGLSDRLRVT